MVNFIICGTQKGGTSALDAYLREHPKICMAEKKEVHFFDNESFFHNKKTDYSIYHSSFQSNKSHDLVGEATPIYMYWHGVPRRIWEYKPTMKLIILLRNPVERAFSHWNMEKSRNAEVLPFWSAIKSEKERCLEELPHQHRVYSYIDRGFYLKQLERIWSYFPKVSTLVLKSEYLNNQPHEALGEVCDFLCIDRLENITPHLVHALPYEVKITYKERDYLQAIFEHEIRSIEKVLTWDCSAWLN